MFKKVLPLLPVLLAMVTVPATAQCANGACEVANEIYNECKYSTTTLVDFKECLCTTKLLVNYERCLNGTICPWDGNPDTLNGPCVKIYCPGTFSGGFDAKAFCEDTTLTATSGTPAINARDVTTSTIATPGALVPPSTLSTQIPADE